MFAMSCTWIGLLHARIWHAVRWYQLTRDLERLTVRTYDMRYPRLPPGVSQASAVRLVDI